MSSHVIRNNKPVKALFVFLSTAFPPSHMIWLAFPLFMIFVVNLISSHIFRFPGFINVTTLSCDFTDLLTNITRGLIIYTKPSSKSFCLLFQKINYIHVLQRHLANGLEAYSMQSMSFPVWIWVQAWRLNVSAGAELWMHLFWQSVVSGECERIWKKSWESRELIRGHWARKVRISNCNGSNTGSIQTSHPSLLFSQYLKNDMLYDYALVYTW